ncbi:hypothetical protein C8F01DRAFT_1101769 [Mycena amicta]|nr:hypothetical protein C8F01DRAFT_1101769 [Mycena amicta]
MTAYESEEPLLAEPIEQDPAVVTPQPTVAPGPQPTVVVPVPAAAVAQIVPAPTATDITLHMLPVSAQDRGFLWFTALSIGFIPICLAGRGDVDSETSSALIFVLILRSGLVVSTNRILRSQLLPPFLLAILYVAIDANAGPLAVKLEPSDQKSLGVLVLWAGSGMLTFILLMAARVDHYSLVVDNPQQPM